MKSDSQGNNEPGTPSPSPFEYPGDTVYKESRTTHLEKRLDKMLLDMQVSLSVQKPCCIKQSGA